MTRPADQAVLIDLGGVLVGDYLPTTAAAWGTRLEISPQAFLAALFGGSDEQVLTGRVSEPAWWDIVAARLHAGPGVMAELRQDLAAREVWDQDLVALLRRVALTPAPPSSATPGQARGPGSPWKLSWAPRRVRGMERVLALVSRVRLVTAAVRFRGCHGEGPFRFRPRVEPG